MKTYLDKYREEQGKEREIGMCIKVVWPQEESCEETGTEYSHGCIDCWNRAIESEVKA